MNFKTYELLSSVIPGFLILLVGFHLFNVGYDSSLTLPYLILAFVVGYANNSFGSWLERLYFFTWGGKPSSKLFNGRASPKVPFYDTHKVKDLLSKETNTQNPSNEKLFAIAQRTANMVRGKQQAYYYAREVLIVYLESKND